MMEVKAFGVFGWVTYRLRTLEEALGSCETWELRYRYDGIDTKREDKLGGGWEGRLENKTEAFGIISRVRRLD